ncbi:hypothetical protein QR685DRAFT_573984 [Neurospora intermedia]|uniref:Uncharacterized protein n=1 Tax=Neurospora intermedia TaxID=5142 RepID=A0ABR3D7Q7_NEUIN
MPLHSLMNPSSALKQGGTIRALLLAALTHGQDHHLLFGSGICRIVPAIAVISDLLEPWERTPSLLGGGMRIK